jgi:pimeloyl-ACP methyl ester carboxylesterase
VSTDLRIQASGLEFTGFAQGPPDAPRTVLLLHGFPQTSRSWRAVAARLSAPETGLRCVAIDQRGYAPSARPLSVAAYALPHLLADVRAVIESLGGPVDLVGHDFGGVVGWQLAARYPELARTYTAVSTANQLAIAEVHRTSAAEREKVAYMRGFRRAGGAAEDELLADGARALRGLYGSAVAPDDVDAYVELFGHREVLTAALNWYRAMSREDVADMPRVTVPTTYVWGTTDPAFSRAVAEATGGFVDADYRFVELAGVGHWVPDQAPDALAEAIIARVQG